LSHIWVAFESHLSHIWVAFESHLSHIWVATTVNTRYLDSTARYYLSLIPPAPHRVRAIGGRWPEGTGRVPVLAWSTEGESGLSRLLSALTGLLPDKFALVPRDSVRSDGCALGIAWHDTVPPRWLRSHGLTGDGRFPARSSRSQYLESRCSTARFRRGGALAPMSPGTGC